MARSVATLGSNVTPLPKPKDEGTLVRTGLYAHMRHPIYTAFDLLAFGWALATASLPRLLLAVMLAAFFDAKANREEAWLVERFPEYPAYRKRVGKFLPGLC
jgi:protein-S-isoprenylcysteine O-methyltransferase Ste14